LKSEISLDHRATLRYSSVLFDLDGTLVDSADGVVASVRYALRQLDARRDPPDRDTILMEVGKPLEQVMAELGYPAEPDRTRRFVEAYRQHYAEHIREGLRPFPDTFETLTALRAAGARLAIVTTKQQAQAELTLAAVGIREFFDVVVGWHEGRKHKPDPEPFLDALARLGDHRSSPLDAGLQTPDPALRHSALVVGDTEQDIIGARAASIDSCAVTYGFRPATMLRGLRPDYMVGWLFDVVGIVEQSA